MGRKKSTRKRNPTGGSYWPYLLAGAGIYLLYQRSRGIGDPPKTEPFPSFPSDEEVIPDSTLAIKFGMTASDIAAAKRVMGPLTQGRMDALLQQQQRDRAYYEGLRPQQPKNVEQLLAAETKKVTSQPGTTTIQRTQFPIPQLEPGQFSIDGVPQPKSVIPGATPPQDRSGTTTIQRTQFPIPQLEPGQFSIDGVPQPKSVTPGATLAPTGSTGQYHLQPPQEMQDYWAKWGEEQKRMKNSFWGAVKSFDPFKGVTASASATDPTKLFGERSRRSGSVKDDDDVSVSRKSDKPLATEEESLVRDAKATYQPPPSQPVKREVAKVASGPSKITYTDEWGRTTTKDLSTWGKAKSFDPLDMFETPEGIQQKTISSSAANPYDLQYEFNTAKKAMAPQRLLPEEARNRSLQPIPSWQLDFSVGNDPSGLKQQAANEAAQNLAQDMGKKASSLAKKYGDIRAVDDQGKITKEGKAIIALESMSGDARTKYVSSKAAVQKLTAKKDELENERQWNAEEMERKAASGNLSMGEKQSFESRNREIDRELKNVRSQMEKPARIVNDIEMVADNLYKGAEKTIKESAVRGVEQQARAIEADKTILAPAETVKTKTFDPGTKSFEEASKGFTPAISPFDQNAEAKRATFQQQLQQQQAAASATRGGFMQQQMEKVQQITAAAAGATRPRTTQQPASGWWQQVSALPQQMRKPSFTVIAKTKPSTPSGGGAPKYEDTSYLQPSIQRMRSGVLSGLFEIETV